MKNKRIEFVEINGVKYLPENKVKSLLADTVENLRSEIETEVRRIGDTSDYPEWQGAAGVNVGLIPKEKILKFLDKLKESK